MLFVVELPVLLAGNVHAYVPGPAEGTLYVCEVPGHTVNTPLMAPNVLGEVVMAMHFCGVE